MTEQARPFKKIQNRINTLGATQANISAAPDYVTEEELAERGLSPEKASLRQRSVLDTLLASGKINWEIILWIVIIALAIVTRMWDLAPRAMHHDESIHAKFSYDMYKGVSVYRYDPTWHGPWLYYMVTLSYFLLGGASEFSARFAPAVYGIGLVAICWFLRPIIGRVGALSFAILMLVSPSILYYSRSLRHDIFATFGMLLFLVGLFRYAVQKDGRRFWWMAVSGLGFFILFGSHEMSFFNLGMTVSWLGLVLLFELVVLPARVRRTREVAELKAAAEAEMAETRQPIRRPLEDDELDDPFAYELEAEDAAEIRPATKPAVNPPASTAVRAEEFDQDEARGFEEIEEERPGEVPNSYFNKLWLGLFGIFAVTCLIGSIHLFSDKTYQGTLIQFLGVNAYLIFIPFYLLLSAAVSYPLAMLIDGAYTRLSSRNFRIAGIAALAAFVGLGAIATFLFLRSHSAAQYLTEAGMKAAGTTSTAINYTLDKGYTGYSQFSYGGLTWPSLLPQLVFLLVAAVLFGALVGWLFERRLLVYTERGIYGALISGFFVLLIATLISLRFIMVPDRSQLPQGALPLIGPMDKWLAYVIGGAVLAVIIGFVAGWLVSLEHLMDDEQLRGSAVLRVLLRCARHPRVVVAFLLGFGILYVLIFSNFFFAPERLADGFYRGLEYWSEQHGKRRLDQPWFYYPMLMLLYETVAVFFTFVALVYFPVNWWKRTRQRGRFIFTPRGVFIGLSFWWTFLALVFYSIAGEKIPWLNMQIALPASLVTAEFLNDYLRRFNWKRFFSWKEGLLFAGLFILMVICSFVLVGMAINFPKVGQFNTGLNRAATSNDITYAIVQMVLVGAIGLALFGVSLWLWWNGRLDGRVARGVIMFAVSLLLFAYCVKSTIALNYGHPDTAIEPMIYTQTTPEVPLFVERLGRLSRDLRDTYKVTPAAPQPGQLAAIDPDPANSKGIPLYVSSEVAWPLSWYLRDYTDVTYGTVNSDPNAANVIDKLTDARGNNYVMILVSSGENTSKLQDQLQGQYTAHQYRFRWHFPEDDSGYGGLGYTPPDDPREDRIAKKDIVNTRWDMFIRSFTEQPYAGRLWRYIIYRELWQPLQSFDMVAYVRNDVEPDFALTDGTSATANTANADSLPAFEMTASSQPGNRNGQYRLPRNITVAPNADFLVLDSLNGRVQRFDKNGTFLSKFGSIGAGDGQFTLAQYESGPGGIATDEDGNIYVTDTWGYRIEKFDKNGTFLAKWGNGQDTKGQAQLDQQYPTSFYGPRSIAYDKSTGELYITDTGNKRIVVYDKNGNFKRQFGTGGSGPGQFDEPDSIVISPDGKLYVADMRNKRIQVLDKQGNYQSEIPVSSWKEVSLNEPYLAFDPVSGDLFASDPANGAILRFDKTGKQVATYNSDNGLSLINPIGITFASDGTLYIADGRKNSIVKFKPQ
ncbi:MAG TPA: 6-bladed beta-propeller [Chloroflexia bacterium]|nr:6-bladed beta-propeller [Chloroflexia bacterium]